MARNIGRDRNIASPRSVAQIVWQRWIGILKAQRAGLRLYQWLWLLLCVAGALAVAAPRILSQPVIYTTNATVLFDTSRYSGFYVDGEPDHHLHIALKDATEVLRQHALAQRDVRFGLPDYRVDYLLLEPGTIQVRGVGPTAHEAQQLASAGSEELVRQIRAAGGREVLRNLLGWELVVAMRSEPIISPFEYHLREIIEQDAFPMSRPVEPFSGHIHVENLTREEQLDLTRALEARYDLWVFEINLHNAALDATCGTATLTSTPEREAALQMCTASNPTVQHELALRDDAIASLRAIEGSVRYMLNEHDTEFTPDTVGVAYRVTATLPAAPEPRHIAALLLLTVLMGVGFGAFGVAIDRSAGVMSKINELWYYRELIQNMVMRDLRARYKSSALGYLWTQLAPLLMMLVFLFVFTQLIPQNIALFPVFLIVALLPWNFCAEAVTNGTRSVIDNAHLVKKVFFPREVLPLVSVCSSLLNYLLSLPMMFLVMAVTQLLTIERLNFSWTFGYMLVPLIIQTLFLVGLAFFLSALAVFLRDTVHLMGVVVQFWFFLTPVFYSLDIIGERLARMVRWLNPMASLVDFYRDILYGQRVAIGLIPTPGLPALDSVLRVFVTALVVLALGYWFFQRQSGRFGEEI